MNARAWGALGLLLACGCDPVMNMRGQVAARPAGCLAEGGVYTDGAPLADATVEVRCPGWEEPALAAQTDAGGRFEAGRVGTFGMDCRVVVEREGYQTVDHRVGDLCAMYSTSFDGCHAFSLNAVMRKANTSDAPAL